MMRSGTRTAIRSAVIACGGIVGVAGVLAFRADDWPIYLAYLILSTALLLPGLEVLPGIRIAIAEMAATIGFAYVAGLPIIVLHWLAPLPGRMLLKALPVWEEMQVHVEQGLGEERFHTLLNQLSDIAKLTREK